MKFILHEIKLWFKDENAEPLSYNFLPNKVNVITGDATTGKTSFWSIIDYCLLSSKMNIANTINEKILWYGITFTINNKYISIARKAPTKDTVASDVFFDYYSLPGTIKENTEISFVKSILDAEFGITDQLRFPYGKDSGKANFNLSYRHFLLFNSLTEDIIGTSKTYFDTPFFGKEEYDKALSHIFNMVIGVNDMEIIKAKEKILQIDSEIKKINRQENSKLKSEIQFEKDVFKLIEKCKEKEFIDFSESFYSVHDALIRIQEIINNYKRLTSNSELFEQIDILNKRYIAIKSQIYAINKYRQEYDFYKKNLNKCADSLKPIEFLNSNLLDQLVDSYETKIFIESLESSLKNIKSNLSRKITEPLKVEGDVKELQIQLGNLDEKIKKLEEIKKNYQTEVQKFVILGEIKYAYEQLLNREKIKPLDSKRLNQLNDDKLSFEKVPTENDKIRFTMRTLLNNSIQRNFDQLSSLPTYKNSKTLFNLNDMVLQLQPLNELFPLETVGSKSNYMLMHLSFYLGLHEHMISIGQEHVPQFLFIDQPSIPYYAGNDGKGNDDKTKLVDAFSLINSFIDYIVKDKDNSFQVLLVEHAPKEYWIDNKLTNFYTVDEFINGKGLIPTKIYNS